MRGIKNDEAWKLELDGEAPTPIAIDSPIEVGQVLRISKPHAWVLITEVKDDAKTARGRVTGRVLELRSR
jgi:hypothetical protein